MQESWNNFLFSTPFIPHGHCYLWQTNLVLLHLLSDSIIALSYYSIPITLFYFVQKRKDLPFSWIFLLFSAFIIACGTTHLLEVWTIWNPIYWVAGSIKALTALISLVTAVELVPLVPKALAIPSPTQLKEANQELQTQIVERCRVENELRIYQNHLEDLVEIRTQEITNTNEKLQRILETLCESEERYRYLVEAIPQLVWTSNSEGECDFFNKNWSEYTGLTFEESLGFGWLAALHPDDIQNAYDIWVNATEHGCLYENEYRFKRANDGSYRWQLARALPLKNEEGLVVKWFGTCTDIHEQKEIQQQRAHLLELEQAARTKAETANRIKNQFLAVLSHELRTPLNSILGWSQLLQTRKFDPAKTEQALATIERNAKLQVKLIEDLLDVSRILQGKLVLNTVNVNVKSTILSAIEIIRLAADSKLIQLNTVFTANLAQVLGDATRLQQIFWNLLSNAVKFTPQGGKIDIHLEQVNGYAQISIRDSGKGISAEFLPYVFDYFRQADGSATRQFGGLGLGLAIARNIVEIHGGTITVESPGLNQGATFIVRLPLVKNDHPDMILEDIDSSDVTTTHLTLNRVRILVVDDDADSRDFLAFILQQDGANVITVNSAVKALEVLAQTDIDVLVSDISMPEMDGYSLMRQLKSWEGEQSGEIPAIPKSIALTAYAGEWDQHQAIEAGFQLHLSKPIVAEELVSAIADLVNKEKF
ncbi:ATP-binding protein [Cronbergia sp. UHCC 0137]|uniref:hybrid sensor histidine kinase/response regulator n=1 Tax=Cronbergia sp. UHCC 0137 TaxID=3110239 RepID=UPI002B1FCEBE|nr:ATP-binding protein [Cronbergia sp. UHCC 0137]MEA5621072.1 ATP-binding protein [Cronbergia sp. UHCC 0137]